MIQKTRNLGRPTILSLTLCSVLAFACTDQERRDTGGFASVSVGVGAASDSGHSDTPTTSSADGSVSTTSVTSPDSPDGPGSTGDPPGPASDASGDPMTTGPAPACGDGALDAGEECDVGALNDDHGACTETCQHAVCGDGLTQAKVEACDDGNHIDDDSCGNNCAPSSCGDGKQQSGEACDDGNADDTDACLGSCLAASCGDGATQAGKEQCDDGNQDQTDACLSNCKLAKCGDGVVLLGKEECDDGNADDADACRNTCKAAKCGDSVVKADEQCDDGNGDNTDGCTTMCQAPKSCKGLLAAVPKPIDGVFVIDPDGVGGTPAFSVYCDMTTAGGGWTLLERSPFGDQTIGRALYLDLPINDNKPGAARHRLSRAAMAALRDLSADMRLDCRGQDYLLTTADQLFNGQNAPPDCFNWSKVLYKEAQLKGKKILGRTMCTWNVGAAEGCAGAWHIDEHYQNAYGCDLPLYPWTGVEITTNSADTFAADPSMPDSVGPVHDCHKNGAARWLMVR